MKIITTQDATYKTQWDHFLISNTNGSHLQLTDWLDSYRSYGFDYELILALEDNKIIGGFGAVIAKFSIFKFYCIAAGPIVAPSNMYLLEQLLKTVTAQAKTHKCCYLQINAPLLNDAFHINVGKDILKKLHYKSGNLFSYVYSSNGLNWLDFRMYSTLEAVLASFKSSVRRDIRSAERKDTTIRFLESEEDIKNAYALCLLNAKSNHYSLRDWESFKSTILRLRAKNWLQCIASFKNDELKGAIFIVKSGNFYTYVFGGTVKEKPDLLTGHLLQWEAIKFSFNENCIGYNSSLGGSEGVKKFKEGFTTEQVLYNDSKHFSVLKPRIFSIFMFLEKKIKPYKSSVASFLAKVKRK